MSKSQQIYIRKLSTNGLQPHVNIPKELVKLLNFDDFLKLELNEERNSIVISRLEVH